MLFAIRAGHDNATIAKFFDLTTTWVWKVRNRLEKSGGDYETSLIRPPHGCGKSEINLKSLKVIMKL